MQFYRLLAILFIFISVAASCKHSQKQAEDALLEGGAALLYEARITEDEPFKNQPNDFCTVIRQLPAFELGDSIDRYCLLDICLDDDEQSLLTIDLGDSEESITANYTLAKVFLTAEEAMQYAHQYGIKDVVINP